MARLVISPAPARALAIRVVREIREREAFASAVLDAALVRTPLSREDAALAHRLVFGTVQMQGSLDVALDRFLDRPAAVEPRVRDALRLAAYELLWSRVPPRAVVSEGVELARSARPAAAGLANAVLRRLAEAAPSFPWGDPSDPAVLALSTGHPRWIVDEWIARYGRHRAESMLAADNAPAPLYVAVNPFRVSEAEVMTSLERDGAAPRPGPLSGCIECGSAADAVGSEAVRDGDAVVCDAAAQLAPAVAGAHPDAAVLDAAAGRGTKTLLLQAASAAAGAPARITAIDVHAFKTRLLDERMRALGVPGVTALTGDSTDLSGVAGVPPVVAAALVDAPCTGLGTLRRHPERRWRVKPDDPARLGELGGRLLASAARLVRPGGVVVYSTCTLTAAENDDVVLGFLASEDGARFRVRDLGDSVPERWRAFVGERGWFGSLPEAGGPDGHFVAALDAIA